MWPAVFDGTVRYSTGQIRDSARRDTNRQTHKYQTRELGSSGPYAMLFCLDDLDKKSIGML